MSVMEFIYIFDFDLIMNSTFRPDIIIYVESYDESGITGNFEYAK